MNIPDEKGGIPMQLQGKMVFLGALLVLASSLTIPVHAQEICRTAGFWGTHAGMEKNGSVNITEEVMRAQMSVDAGMDFTQTPNCVFAFDSSQGSNTVTCSFDPPGPAGSPKDCRQAKADDISMVTLFPPGANGLAICGQVIDVKDPDSPDIAPAIQALCVSPNDDSRNQLARQLTAASLNCIAGGGGPDCQNISIGDMFSHCNEACADPNTQKDQVSLCIEQVDCYNNGGVWNTSDPNGAFCQLDVPDSCHGQPLVFTVSPPAGPVLQ